MDVDTPAAADAFDIETLTQDTNLAPGVPIRGDKNFVSIDDVVFHCLALEEGMDAKG